MTEAQKATHFTVMIMPNAAGRAVRRVRVSKRWLGACLASLALGLAALVVAASSNVGNVVRDQKLKAASAERARLTAELEALHDRVRKVDQTVERIRARDARVRTLTLVSDPGRLPSEGRELAEFVLSPEHEVLFSAGGADRGLELVQKRLQVLEVGSKSAEASLQQLSTLLEGQRALLASTPSRRPTTGYRSSGFGSRVDPFTGIPQMHSGVDFSASEGTRVEATADGVVVFAGQHGAYGNMIQVDHGNGLSSCYGHLSEMRVRVGDKIQRGQFIGAVGSTGRATGPHLHYEVRMQGVPVDPERFILE